ncbi:MAG: tetratricopeptide repeat protein [Labilithrix sp.]|nr:tetratricopeptide repeat protein [Labilithrix sp.]MCW5817485.1 tetratricopeptide repeat protein [Labilithrix sp.]
MKRALATLLLFGAATSAACAPNRGAAYEKAVGEARTAYGRGRYDVAAERWDEAARTAKVPRDGVYARYEAALARARAGDVARASAELKKLADENNAYSAPAAYKAADLTARKDPEAGRRELEAVALRYPDHAMAKVAFARVLRHTDEAGPTAALAYLDTIGPKVAGKALEEDVLYQRARRLAEAGQTIPARDAFLAIADRWPYPHGAYFDDSLFRASELEEKLARPREAIAHLERLLSFREMSVTIGSYERPRYIPAILRVAKLHEETLNDRAAARAAYHRLYREFKTSTLRDDALWHEAELWQKDGDQSTACDRLSTLTSDFPDSRYVPCAVAKCPSIKRPPSSKSPTTCRPYLTREPTPDGPTR